MLLRALRSRLTSALSWRQKLPFGSRPEKNDIVLFLSLDCTAAFNAVPVDKIVDNLLSMGIPETPGIANWLGAGSTPRRQRLQGQTTWTDTTSGVPQGSVLGPILWLVYLDPILEAANNNTTSTNNRVHSRWLSAFADDISLFVSGNEREPPTHAAGQRGILDLLRSPRADVEAAPTGPLAHLCTALANWTRTVIEPLQLGGIKISSKSSLHLLAGANGARGLSSDGLSVHGFPASITPVKLLGSRLDNNLSNASQLASTLATCDRLLDRLNLLKDVLHPATLNQLYVSYVVPHITYAASSNINVGWNAPSLAPAKAGSGRSLPASAAKHFPETLDQLDLRHHRAARIISGCYATAKNELCLSEAGLWPLRCISDRLITREDEVVARLHRPDAIAPLPVPLEPVLTHLPYEPPWAGLHCHNVNFFLDVLTPDVTRDSPADLRSKDNQLRLDLATQWLDGEFLTLATDGSIAPSSSSATLFNGAGAAALFHGDTLIGSSSRPAGSYACSYSAECRGADAGLLDLVLANLDLCKSVGRLLWITDSRSLASALHKGCLLQTEFAEARIWKALLDLAALGVRVAVAWIFSHANSSQANEFVDELAGQAAVAPLLAEPPAWFIDAARHRFTPTFKQYLSTIPKDPDIPSRTLVPRKLQKDLGIPSKLQRLLACLRSGVWAPLGFTEEHPDCPVCGSNQALGKLRGVKHLFVCPAQSAVSLRVTHGVESYDSLWSPERTAFYRVAVAKYALDFKRLIRDHSDPPRPAL
eukprot:GILI01007257.1.p1 GENE.GILI01007257.1~~GILI01007257.1.p1  ORF type:complete len:810 (+),score=124.09 GILI01007257.1:147-2432(+)